MTAEKTWKLKLTTLGLAGLCASCSPGSSSSGSSAAGSNLSSFASTLAEDVVLASPTSRTASAKRLAKRLANREGALDAPSASDTASEKADALEALLATTAPSTCAINITLTNSGRNPCYGPSVDYTNHEMNNSSGQWPGGDLGIWEANASTGEACISTQLTQQMAGVISYIDMAQFISAGMACVANKNSQTLPSENAELDLTSLLSGVITLNSTAVTVTEGKIARLANDTSGNPVYLTTLVGTVGSNSVSIRIKHIPTSSDDSTNKGKISVKYSTSSATDGVSLEYAKTSATSATMLLKKINFNSSSADPFVSTSNQTVDFTKSWNNNADYLLAQFNPSDYTGTFAYAWQAGNGDSNTRVFNAKITSASGTVSGSTFFGFGPTVQTGAGEIDGMICAWTGPDATHTPVSKVQRQNIVFSTDKFVVSGTSYTVFDPVADCEASGSMAMSWNSGASTRNVSDTTENLAPLSEYTTEIGTLPTAPTNVDL